MHIDHITIRTRDLPTARDFFLMVFDLEEKPRPKAIQRIPGHWLYSGENPIVHLIGSRGPGHGHGQDYASETFDHVGFKLEGYSGFRSKLERLGIPYSPMDLPELNERRLFLRTPGGPIVEAVFTEPMPE